MKSVEPIRNRNDIVRIKKYLKKNDLRSYVMFTLGINVALRISDLLNLKWSDILNLDKDTFKDLTLYEGKTKKYRRIKLNDVSQKALKELMYSIEDLDIDQFIFKSREGNNKPITRQQARNILKNASKTVGINENIGTHSLRKTWGYFAWKNGFNPAIIMETLNHSNLEITKRYLGIQQDDINELYHKLNI